MQALFGNATMGGMGMHARAQSGAASRKGRAVGRPLLGHPTCAQYGEDLPMDSRGARDVHASAHSASFSKSRIMRKGAFESTHPDAIRRRKEREERKAVRQAERELENGAVNAGLEWWQAKPSSAPNMVDCFSEGDFHKTLAMAHGGDADDRATKLVVVEYYKTDCPSCRMMYPKLCKIAEENQDVVFLKVNADHCRDLCMQLGVEKLPWFHVYLGAHGKVAEFTANAATVDGAAKIAHAIELYSLPMCALDSEVPEVEGLPALGAAEGAGSIGVEGAKAAGTAVMGPHVGLKGEGNGVLARRLRGSQN